MAIGALYPQQVDLDPSSGAYQRSVSADGFQSGCFSELRIAEDFEKSEDGPGTSQADCPSCLGFPWGSKYI